MIRTRLRFPAILTFLFMFAGASVQAGELEDAWDNILRDHVHPAVISGIPLNTVDYRALKKDQRWPHLVELLSRTPEPGDEAGKKAFWFNAYNILAIDLVLSGYPVSTIKDIGPWYKRVWNIDAGTVAGSKRSLGEIEHDILRPMGDPRFHAAVVCASLSCPDLRTEAYRRESLDHQLDDQMRDFLANPAKGARVEKNGDVLRVSWIFDYFEKDFEQDGQDVFTYLQDYLPEHLTSALSNSPKLRYLDYDWSLNDRARAE